MFLKDSSFLKIVRYTKNCDDENYDYMPNKLNLRKYELAHQLVLKSNSLTDLICR